MTRNDWLISILMLGAFWMVGWTVWIPRIESSLETAARDALASGSEARWFRDVTITFSGQQAVLAGTVTREPHRQLAQQIIQQQLRATPVLGMRLSPLTTLTNSIETEPLPPGWALLAVAGDTVHLEGVAASEPERDAIVAEVQRSFARPGIKIRPAVRIDDERAGECADLGATLKSLAPVLNSSGRDGVVLAARLGGNWRSFHSASGDEIRDALLSAGSTPEEWERTLAPLVKSSTEVRVKLRLAAEEEARLAKLPPPHLFIAMRGNEVMLRGAVGTAELKNRIIESALHAYRGLRLLDEIRVAADRRPRVDLTGLLQNLPPASLLGTEQKIALGIPGHPWGTASVAGKEPGAAVGALLPSGFDPGLAAEDGEAVTGWLKSTASSSAGKLLPYLALSIFDDRVWLRGEVAEESTRSQILDAARRMYPNHVLVHFIRLNARRASAADRVPETCRSFPPAPAANETGVMAFALAGDSWQAASVAPEMFSLDGFAKSGIVPKEFATEAAYEEFEESIDALRAHLEHLKASAGR